MTSGSSSSAFFVYLGASAEEQAAEKERLGIAESEAPDAAHAFNGVTLCLRPTAHEQGRHPDLRSTAYDLRPCRLRSAWIILLVTEHATRRCFDVR